MNELDLSALELHQKNLGKIGLELKVPLSSKEDLSLAYSPGVAAVSKEIAADESAMYRYTGKGNTVAVVSDGSAVLGLGNVGAAAAYPVMEGKAALFKAFAGVEAYPICLDTQDNDAIVDAVCALAVGFGGINLEDIAAPRCFEIEAALKKRLSIPVFHDDQHGTAIVVLAGLLNSLKVTGRFQEKENSGPTTESAYDLNIKIVINGAGAAGHSIAKLLAHFGFTQIFVLDSKGLIYSGRNELNKYKQELAADAKNVAAFEIDMGEGSDDTDLYNLKSVLKNADVFIGVSKANLVSKDMVKSMAQSPIVFALANPDPEIPEKDALDAGAAVVATGRSDSVNQINNVLVFPGLFRGILDAGLPSFNVDMYIRAAKALSEMVKNPSSTKIIPSAFDDGVAEVIAKAVKA